jgi:hypothetical protein
MVGRANPGEPCADFGGVICASSPLQPHSPLKAFRPVGSVSPLRRPAPELITASPVNGRLPDALGGPEETRGCAPSLADTSCAQSR